MLYQIENNFWGLCVACGDPRFDGLDGLSLASVPIENETCKQNISSCDVTSYALGRAARKSARAAPFGNVRVTNTDWGDSHFGMLKRESLPAKLRRLDLCGRIVSSGRVTSALWRKTDTTSVFKKRQPGPRRSVFNSVRCRT